ncbi:MAG: POTRA domain-containing protein, partial [Ignavibacteriaceae bacterium]
MTKLLFVLTIFILSYLPQSYAQSMSSDSSSIRVDSIKISGNKITDEYVILRELTFQEGDTVNSKILSYNKERIYSLGIFSNVKVSPELLDGKNIINILVSESWYIYPIPFAQLKDNDWKKISYGIDFYVQNFQGMNDRIRLHAAFGYDPNYLISYSNPYFIKDEDIFLGANLSYIKARNKSDIAKSLYGGDFDQKISGGDISIGKRIG